MDGMTDKGVARVVWYKDMEGLAELIGVPVEGRTVYISPENNLHPVEQVKFVEEIGKGCTVVTSSPYIAEAFLRKHTNSTVYEYVKGAGMVMSSPVKMFDSFAEPFRKFREMDLQ